MRKGLVLLLGLACLSCQGPEESPAAAADPLNPPAHASFEMTARILGPVDQDDDSDMEVTLRETGGVAATLHFVRLTCSNGRAQEWGASSFVGEWGTNTIAARAEVQFRRHYHCPNSGRPSLLMARLTDANGIDLTVEAVPYHPDWPG